MYDRSRTSKSSHIKEKKVIVSVIQDPTQYNIKLIEIDLLITDSSLHSRLQNTFCEPRNIPLPSIRGRSPPHNEKLSLPPGDNVRTF